MSTPAEQIKAEIEAVAKILSIAPSTVGKRAGQGGQFYTRLTEGKRVWPETAAKVRKRLEEMQSGHEVIVDDAPVTTQASAKGDAA